MKRELSLPQLLFIFFVFILSMLAIRIYISGKMHFVFLIWNIFLAFIPFAISSYILPYWIKKDNRILFFLTTCIWMLFFPNALYIVTDLIHLQLQTSIPKWFDAVILFSSAILGLLLAFISLRKVEHLLTHFISSRKVNVITFLILAISSFGVYLGRFLRWNSWDILQNPFELLKSIAERVCFPLDHLRTWVMTFLLSILFYLLYNVIKQLPRMIVEPENA